MKSVTIIVPVHNPSLEFEETIKSLLNQCYRNTIILLIDDCSTSGLEILSKYSKHNNVQILKTEKNRGGGYARNIGLSRCSSDYISFCDSDDVWPTDKLSKQISLMEQNGLKMTHTDMVSVNAIKGISYELPTNETVDLKEFLCTTSLYCSTVCIDSSILGDNEFSELRIRHPFKFWVSILDGGVVSHRVPDVKVSYLVRAGSVSSKALLTLAYTLHAYLFYPKNKWLAIRCLLIRTLMVNGRNSRIFGGLFK